MRMGYMAHDAAVAVVPSYRVDVVQRLGDFRAMIDRDYPNLADFFIGPIETVNLDMVYAFLPDGSKEGWDLSDDGEALRQSFIEIARGDLEDDDGIPFYNGGDVIHARFGGDYGAEQCSKIIFTTDHPEELTRGS